MQNLSGKLDRRVRLDYEVKGANGEPNPVWVELATTYGGKKDESTANEGPEGKTYVATGITTWLLRYRSGILPTMRIVDLSTDIVYDIEGVSEIGRREALSLKTVRRNK